MRHVVASDVFGPSFALACSCAALAFAPQAIASSLQWDRAALDAGEFWRLWTGHLVHYSSRHALLDSVALLLAGWMAERHFGAGRVVAIVLLCAPFMSLALLVVPDIAHYRGASGLATLLAALAGFAIWRDRPACRAPLVILLGGFLAKIAADASDVPLTLSALPPAVSVAWQVHLFGIAIAAFAFAMIERGIAPGNASLR